MKEKEAEFDSCRFCILFSCCPKQGCKITTHSEITVSQWSEIWFALTSFIKHSLLLKASVKTGCFHEHILSISLPGKCYEVTGDGATREGSWRESCNQTSAPCLSSPEFLILHSRAPNVPMFFKGLLWEERTKYYGDSHLDIFSPFILNDAKEEI